MTMRTDVRGHDGSAVLHVAGEVDIATSPHLLAEAARLAGAGGDVRLDLTDVTFIDSSALGILVRIHNDLRRRGDRLQLVAVSERVEQVLRLTALDRLFACGSARLDRLTPR